MAWAEKDMKMNLESVIFTDDHRATLEELCPSEFLRSRLPKRLMYDLDGLITLSDTLHGLVRVLHTM